MSGHSRPFLSKVVHHAWTKPGQPDTPGISLIGRGGLSAHLTASEAVALADQLHDLAEQLEPATPTNPRTPAGS